MSLEDEEWPLWSKKEGTQIWEMRHKAKFIKFTWKFGIWNLLVATCTLTLSWNLEHFTKSILGKLFWSLGSQESNTSNGTQIGAKTRKLCSFEANWLERKTEFEMSSKCLHLIQNASYSFITHNFVSYCNNEIN